MSKPTHENGQPPKAARTNEIKVKAERRRFTAAYKLGIVQEANECQELGQIGAMLRREGLYSSQLADWRQQAKSGQLKGLEEQKRGRKQQQSASERELARVKRENERLKEKLSQAELIIEAQKKLAELLEKIASQKGGQP
jgi:transposase